MEGPIDNPIPVSPLGPLGEGADVPGGWCTECGAEYRIGFTRCADCDADLSHDPPSMVESRHDIVEYDLANWVSEQYTELNEQLDLSRIVYRWRGTTLEVPGAHEAAVDELIDAIDELPTVEPDVEYEFGDWTPAQCDDLISRVHEAGIPCTWDGLTLAVAESDEAAVDALVLEVDPTFPTS